MFKKVLLFVMFAVVVAGCGGSAPGEPPEEPVQAWYEGGTLHAATAGEWAEGEYDDQLATAADWITVITEYESLDEAKVMAEELVTCVNEVAPESPEELGASEIGVSCAVLMGWELKE